MAGQLDPGRRRCADALEAFERRQDVVGCHYSADRELNRVDLRSTEFHSDQGLDSRLEHVRDHRRQLAIEPFEEHLTRQLVRPCFRVAHPSIELLLEDPFPVVRADYQAG